MRKEGFLEEITFWSFLRGIVGGSVWKCTSEKVKQEGNAKVVKKNEVKKKDIRSNIGV